jgi:hypothetical protein
MVKSLFLHLITRPVETCHICLSIRQEIWMIHHIFLEIEGYEVGNLLWMVILQSDKYGNIHAQSLWYLSFYLIIISQEISFEDVLWWSMKLKSQGTQRIVNGQGIPEVSRAVSSILLVDHGKNSIGNHLWHDNMKPEVCYYSASFGNKQVAYHWNKYQKCSSDMKEIV